MVEAAYRALSNWREKPALSVPEAAQILGISRSLAYEAVKNGQIPTLKMGVRRIIVPTVAIERMLEQAAK